MLKQNGLKLAHRLWKILFAKSKPLSTYRPLFLLIAQLPEQWKNFFYQWEPQIWNVLQQFAWVRRIDQQRKQVELQIQLKTEATADISLKTPNAVVGRTNMLLPLRVERFPSSYEDIMNNVYGKHEIECPLMLLMFTHFWWVLKILSNVNVVV